MRSFPSQISFILLLLLFATTFNRSICTTIVGKEVLCNENDQNILLIFKQGVLNSSNRLSSWTSQEDCCLWEGVHCNNITGRVTKLDLANHELPRLGRLQADGGLQGVINLSLLQLESLNYLDLSFNHFTSVCIPPCQVSKFPLHRDISHNQSIATSCTPSANFSAPLHYLDFSGNDMALNDLRWLSQLSSVKYLNLSGNDIGSEPKWLQHVAMLPALSELRLVDCGLRDFPSYNYVNFTSLKTLVLYGNNFSSKLPDSFFNATKDISSIDLAWNNFYGGLPIALFKLPNLNYLSLSNNKIEGSVPSLVGNLSSLISLDLYANYFSGSLPESLGQLHKLSDLSIGGNSWAGVLSERNFANVTSLTILDLSSTGFKFDFDPNWVPPFQLKYFASQNTSLGPNFPAWLYTQSSLKVLHLPRSMISNINTDIFGSFIARIESVDLSNNFISGDISNVTLNSYYVNIEYNNFSGGLPHISANVSRFYASHNSFSGSIFPLLCLPRNNGKNLYYLDLSYNHLSGILPNCWANWKQLSYVNLRSNKLTGKVPPSMASLNLKLLDLGDNNLFGKFSFDLLNWTNLQCLVLEGNEFSGSLPNPAAQNLVVIKLRNNQFRGNIPSQLCNLSSLTILDLAENKLSGSIPHCLYNLMPPNSWSYTSGEMIEVFTKGRELEYEFGRALHPRSGVIDLSANILSGEIPKELFGISQMQTMNLSRNQLIGKIPKEIGDVTILESLDLSYNRLSGEIPSTISNLSFLAYLNLSYNNFIGQIPLGTQIQSFDSWSFVGNHKLCGDPLPRKCNKKEETHDDSKLAEVKEDDNFLKSLYLGMGVGFAVGFWGVCGSLFLIKAWRHKFFQWFDHLVDQIYVTLILCFKSFS
ncbi:hypothetical protein K1719_013255 [Acacia pycnantha]|nr:hypothetical protein K1719_013255 [Acacia pycnantha]